MKSPLHQKDFYKTDHRRQYPKGTTKVYSNFTARSDRLAKMSSQWDHKVVFFGLQYFIVDYLMREWNFNFFNRSKETACLIYKRRLDTTLGPDAVPIDHIEALHDLGYLPIEIKALEEGTRVPMKVPMLTITNTKPAFFWLPNMLETVISCELWKPITTATIAYEYRRLLEFYANLTGAPKEFVQFQGHDFSMRGISGRRDPGQMGHLVSFTGTDTIPAIDMMEKYYGADASKELVGTSVPATEHSVMCMGGDGEAEIETFRRLITEIYPTGVVSIVSDTWDFWKVITEYTVQLKNEIMTRQPNALGLNKVVFRPDSGDPVKIICGDPEAMIGSTEYKGAVECLWDIFGGEKNEAGYKILDPHVGLIYGDSITLERAEAILKELQEKGFASSNIVFGIGSYTYQYITRDTFGMAMKATYGEVNGKGREIYKDPKTDNGVKKSARGLLRVETDKGEYILKDQVTREQEMGGHLNTVFKDGELRKFTSLSAIRQRLLGEM